MLVLALKPLATQKPPHWLGKKRVNAHSLVVPVDAVWGLDMRPEQKRRGREGGKEEGYYGLNCGPCPKIHMLKS